MRLDPSQATRPRPPQTADPHSGIWCEECDTGLLPGHFLFPDSCIVECFGPGQHVIGWNGQLAFPDSVVPYYPGRPVTS